MINSLLLFHVLHQAVRPSTGDVVYDEFEDGPSFAELETRFEHIAPEELLLPESVTLTTENFIREYVTRVQRFVIEKSICLIFKLAMQ